MSKEKRRCLEMRQNQKPKGWRNEPGRHALAARGVKTTTKGLTIDDVHDKHPKLWNEEFEYKGFSATFEELLMYDSVQGLMKVADEIKLVERLLEHDGDLNEVDWDSVIERLLYDAIKRLRKENPRRVIENLSQDEVEKYLAANIKSQERTSYGRRREEIEWDDFTVVTWSNAAKQWNASPWHGQDKEKGDTIELDANMMIVPGKPEEVEKFADFIQDLPLYKYSTEADMRGEAAEDKTLNWALKQLDRESREKYKEQLEDV